MRIVVIVALLVAGAVAGFFGPRLLQLPSQANYRYKFPDQDVSARPIAPNQHYACSAITQAEAYENRLDGPTGDASAGKGGDEVTLKVSGDGSGISIELPFDVTNGSGVTAEPIPIIGKGEGGTIIANRVDGLDIITLVLDTNTLKAVFSYTGQGMAGIRGRSILIACR